MMTRILCLSDTHGVLDDPDLRGIDLVLHAGDFSCANKYDYHTQILYYKEVFSPWVRRIAAQCPIYWIAGNHEMFMETDIIKDKIWVNDIYEQYCLNDHFAVVNNLKIAGFPYTPTFYNWAFNRADTPEELGQLCETIPADTDILLTHGPPFGINDIVYRDGHNTHQGSKELLRRVDEIKPQVIVSGHLHDHHNYGEQDYKGIRCIGCSQMNERYKNVNPPYVIKV